VHVEKVEIKAPSSKVYNKHFVVFESDSVYAYFYTYMCIYTVYDMVTHKHTYMLFCKRPGSPIN
jgi:hypothetical protein